MMIMMMMNENKWERGDEVSDEDQRGNKIKESGSYFTDAVFFTFLIMI